MQEYAKERNKICYQSQNKRSKPNKETNHATHHPYRHDQTQKAALL